MTKASELFGKKLRMLRNSKGYSREYCVAKIGCSTKAWYRWEKGLTYPLPAFHKGILELIPELRQL